jgi:hypothetical protein
MGSFAPRFCSGRLVHKYVCGVQITLPLVSFFIECDMFSLPIANLGDTRVTAISDEVSYAKCACLMAEGCISHHAVNAASFQALSAKPRPFSVSL